MSTSLLLEKLFFFRKEIYFSKIFWLRPRNFFFFLEKTFSSVFKTAFNVSRRSLGEKVSGKLFLSSIVFYSWTAKIEFSMKNFPQSVKIVSYVWTPTNREEICFRLNRNITLFGVSVKIFPRGSSKLQFTWSQPTFEHLIKLWWKICIYKFFGMWAKDFQTMGKKARADWQESMFHVRRKLLVSHTFSKRMFFL